MERKINNDDQKPFVFYCSTCKRFFESESAYNEHIRIDGVGRRLFYCSICPWSAIELDSVVNHLRTNHHVNVQLPTVIIIERNVIETGLVDIERKISELYRGEGSDKSIKIIALHNIADRKLYSCSRCRLNFRSIVDHDEHFIRQHNGYPCHVCGELLDSPQALEEHAKMNENRNDESPGCGTSQGNLNLSSVSHEEPEINVYLCNYPECGEVFATEEDLDRHLEDDHEDNTCDVCNESFNTKSELSAHVRSHVKEKVRRNKEIQKKREEADKKKRPHECNIGGCRQRFKTEQELDEHIDNFHKPWECNICRKLFTLRAELEEHLRTHDKPTPRTNPELQIATRDERPKILSRSKGINEYLFQCLRCGERFTSEQQAADHLCI